MRHRAPGLVMISICAGFLAPPLALAIDAAEWRHLPPLARSAYVTGVLDAWNGLVAVQESLGSRDVGVTVFGEVVACVRDRLIPYPRVVTIVERYADDNPGLLSKDMPDLVFAALNRDCKQ